MNLPDFNSCEAEPIRFPGAVQPHGIAMTLRPGSATVSAVSESVEALLGFSPDQMLGQPLGQYVGETVATAIVDSARQGTQSLIHLRHADREWVARCVASTADEVLIDIEVDDTDAARLLKFSRGCRQCVNDLRTITDVGRLALAAAHSIRAMTGLDRVMVYRFDEEWNGEVIAEAHVEGIEPFLGLHFPASDIPRQARELYLANKLRQIPDVLYTPSGLVSETDRLSINLSQSSLRSVSPVHIEYLKNMGVGATLVGSLLVDGRLWGLISCQHISGPRYFGPGQRDLLCGLFEDIAARIEVVALQQRRERETELTIRRRRLMDAVREEDLRSLIDRGRNADILNVVGADGFALLANDSIYTTGLTPVKSRIHQLQQRRLEREPNLALFASSALGRDLSVEEIADGVSGVLFVSLAEKPATTLIWFRQERRYTVNWGGDPEQPHLVDSSGRLSPRQSFAKFLQEIRGQSVAWSPEETESAREFGSLIEIEALREREAFSHTIFDANPEHVAVLDKRGVIVAVNLAWRQFASKNDAPAVATGSIGLNYREICRAAACGPDAGEASAAWTGIEAVLNGTRDSFTLDYPCSSPIETRWFTLSVHPMADPCEGAVVSHGDITERKKFEIAEARLRGMFSAMTEGVVVQDNCGRIVDTNKAAEQILALSRDQLLGRQSVDQRWRALYEDGTPFPGEQHPAMVTLRTGNPVRDQVMGVYAPGVGLRWISINSVPVISTDRNSPLHVVSTFIDITTRREALASLHESEERFRLAFDQSSSGMVLTYLNGVKFRVNAAYCNLYDCKADDVLGRYLGFRSLIDSAAEKEKELFARIAGGEISSFTMQQEQKDKFGRVCLVQHSVSVICDSAKLPAYCLVHVENLTEYRRRQLESLAAHTLQTQEEERTRLSRELHDDVGQSLTALKLLLLRVQRNCNVGKANECLNEAAHTTEKLMNDVRTIAYRLRPSQLDELGLMSSLRWHLDKVVRPAGLLVELAGNVDGGRFPADLESHCFRVAQEALTNVVKHAQATHVVVGLNESDGHLILRICDNGIGFDTSQQFRVTGDAFSLGLIGMSERVAALGGNLEVNSVLAQGTEVVVTLPLKSA